MFLDMGLGAQSGASMYAGPAYSSPASVAGSGGYGDTGRGSITGLAFGPQGVTGGGAADPGKHALVFGILCFAGLLFMAWTLPR